MPRDEQEQENRGEIVDTEYSECASTAERSAYCCRSVALIVSLSQIVFSQLLSWSYKFDVLRIICMDSWELHY